MKVSIVTVVYNNVSMVADAIESVLNQDYPDLEYILIDGASTDGTTELVRMYQNRITRVISEKDEGLYDAINKGIRMCSGDIIGLLHSDDFYPNNKVVSSFVKAFEEKNTDAVYGDLVYVDKEDTQKVIRYWQSGEFDCESFYKGWMPPHPALFIKKECYLKYGVYDTRFKSAADYELTLRILLKNKISATYLPIVMASMRTGGKSNSSLRNRLMANIEDYKAWKINDLQPKFYTRFMKPLSKIPQYFHGITQEKLELVYATSNSYKNNEVEV
ncbi:glycosyl transferase [Bernardetia litoralis DSM 6794]|uniref:Glycosyl transferase n=1 Tax=Bernardetia litoralis (strain ATCC 23117 / DSM 6794 / NBRC 15988 / NCIMB 1366 / Fx l1 / Sio-4) TaxID=880071 RepID=I4AF23_BERLS|nr:glycosyltransferase family 2 protein [Bernardetia litoralis]AFM02558.1 glycosyl transferase [Bernardetia litoralis DSM 6794]